MARRNFKDKRVSITGAAGGLGRAMSFAFGKRGAHIIGLDLRAEDLERWKEELADQGISAEGHPCDVTDQERVEEIFSEVVARGGVDVLVNNAGISHVSAFSKTDLSVIRKVMEINFFGTVYCTHATMASITENKGLVVAISSVAGFAPLIARTGYAASKHAVEGFFSSLRTEVKPDGVQVLIVRPSFIATGINKNALGKDGGQAKQNRLHIGKKMTPEYVAERIVVSGEKNRDQLVIGKPARMSYWLQRFFPRIYAWGMARKLAGEMED